MKKIILPLCTVLTLTYAQTIKTIPKGWSLNGIGLNENSLDPSTLPNDISTVWKYSDGSWQAYSGDTDMADTLKGASITELNSIDQGEGFWINASKPTSFSSTILSKFIPNSFETSEDSTYDDYTYNYTTSAGLIQSDKIAWDKAASYLDADDFNETTLSKTIPKVFSSLNKKTQLIIYSVNCNTDVTIAVTPYSSINSIPGVTDLLVQNASKNITSSTTTGATTNNDTTWSLISYSGNNIEVVKEFSSDISVEDSSGNKLSPSQLDSVCTDLDAYVLFSSGTLDTNSAYKLHYINGYNDINSTDITLTQLSSKIKLDSEVLKNLKPFYISKSTTESLGLKSDLAVSIKGTLVGLSSTPTPLFTSKVDGTSISFTGSTSASSFPSIDDITDSYDVVYALSSTISTKHYITPANISGYTLFGYDSLDKSWKKITQNTTGTFSHFVVAKAKTVSSNPSAGCTGNITLDSYTCGDTITLEKGKIDYYNVNNFTTSYSVTNEDTNTTKVKKDGNEVEIIAWREGTEKVTVSDTQGNSSTFDVVITATQATTNINGTTWLNAQPDNYYDFAEAKAYCDNLGYRLPTGDELLNAWKYYGELISPPYFEKNTFYLGEDTNGTARGCPMDADCSNPWVLDTSGSSQYNAHPRCVIK